MAMKDRHEGCTVHVGGVTGFLEESSFLKEFCEDTFGPVLAAHVRLRHDTPGKTSWALVTYQRKELAQHMAVVMGPAVVVPDPKAPGNESLKEKARMQARFRAECAEIANESPEEGAVVAALGPVKLVDRLQVLGSTGRMGSVMRAHQKEVEQQLAFLRQRVRPTREHYADAVLASHIRRGYQEPSHLVVLKDEARQHDADHRGWDVRVRPKDQMFDLMRKIRERIDGMADAEGIIRTDEEVKMGRKLRIRTVRQMKHARTYLIRHRAAPLTADEAFELAVRFARDEENAKWSGFGINDRIVVKMQRMYRARMARRIALEQADLMARHHGAVQVQCAWRKWITREIYTALSTSTKPSFSQKAMADGHGMVEAVHKPHSTWGTLRSILGVDEQLQQRNPKKDTTGKEDVAHTVRERWNKVRSSHHFRTVVLKKIFDGNLLGAFRHVRVAQHQCTQEFKKYFQVVQEQADILKAEHAAKRAQGRWRGALAKVSADTAKTTEDRRNQTKPRDPGRSVHRAGFNIAMVSADLVKLSPQSQAKKAAILAKSIERVSPSPRPPPMATANYSVGGAEDCSWNKPVMPVPMPRSATEAALLMSGGPRLSSPSPRQRRATLSAQQLLARRGYLTPRDLDVTRGPGTPDSCSRTARTALLPSDMVPVADGGTPAQTEEELKKQEDAAKQAQAASVAQANSLLPLPDNRFANS